MTQLAQSKKNKAQAFFKQHENILICPYCHEPMYVEGYSLSCKNHHCFDISKKGYLNVATTKGDDHYDHSLFEARKTMIQEGLFLEIQEKIQLIINKKNKMNKEITLLDVGTGDGSLLSQIHHGLDKSDLSIVGLDLSKAAIALATNEDTTIGWLVGDLGNIPLSDHSIDVILNVFSPANYTQFNRLLKTDGYLIKVIPVENHFKEVRDQNQASAYPFTKTVEIKETLKKYASLESCTRVMYTYPLTKHQQSLITIMSPLSKNQSKNVVLESTQITIDVEILVATFK